MNYVIIHEIVRNIITVIVFIFAFFLFITRVIKETSFHIVNFNVIEKIFFFYSNIKLRDFQIIEKRRFLINEIINEIAVLKSRFNYYTFIVVKILIFIHNRRYRKCRNNNDFFLNIEQSDDFKILFLY